MSVPRNTANMLSTTSGEASPLTFQKLDRFYLQQSQEARTQRHPESLERWTLQREITKNTAETWDRV